MDYKINNEQQDTFDIILSGILPHENCDPVIASNILKELNKFLLMKDLYGTYYVFWKILKNLDVINLYRSGYTGVFNEDILEKSLQISLNDLIQRNAFDAERFFADYGQAFNLQIPSEKKDAMDYAYTAIMNKYSELYNMKIPSPEALANVSVLLNDMKHSMAALAVSLQSQVLMDGVFYNGREYQGYDAWVSFGIMISNEIQSRFTRGTLSKRHNFSIVSNYEDSLIFDKENERNVRPLWYMGFEPVDNRLPIRTHDIVTIVADEGTGKTRMMVDQAYKAMLAGNNVVFACGETDEYKIKKSIEARHLWTLYNRQLTVSEVADPTRIPIEDESEREELQNMIISSAIDLYDNPKIGKLTFIQSLVYETVEEQLREEHKHYKFDAVFIDHVAALDYTGNYVNGERLGSMNERITHLYKVEDVLGKELDVAFINASHTNNDTASALRRNKETGVRIGGQSASTTKYASLVVLISQTSDMKQQDQIVLEYKKIRDFEPITYPLLISRNSSNAHEYHEELQYLVKGEVVDNDNLEDLY